jgi:hypothetical protein
MAIDFSCTSCNQRYRVKDEFAGKTTKCKKCGAAVTVPKLEPALPEPVDELGSLLDEELGPVGSPKPQPAAAAGKPCPSCLTPLADDAVLCTQCGYDLVERKVRKTERPDAPEKKKKKRSGGGAFAGSGPLLKGVAFSTVGAVLGAIVWAIVAVITQREFGWIAIAVGGAAGGGMAAGADDRSDGTIPGIIAAFLSLGGIVLGKILIVVWVVFPLLAAGGIDDVEIKRAVLAGAMATDALEKQGINPDAATDEQLEREQEIAMQAIAQLSDEEVNRRYEETLAAIRQKAETAPQLAQNEPEDQADAPQPRAASGLGEDPLGEDPEEPSLVSLFFSTMFGPIDGLFILLAFATAYRLGSGAVTD